MRILMLTPRYSPLVGGIETHVREVGMRMAALGHEVTVLTTDATGTLPSEEHASGMTIRRARAWPRDGDLYFSPGVYGEISQGRWDILHVQGYHTFVAPIGMLAAIRWDIPFVLTFHSGGHSSRLRNAVRGIQHAVLAPLAARARHLIGVSEFEAAFFSKRMGLDPKRFTVVPNGASLPARSHAAPADDGHLVVSIGRLERYKGHQRVIRAFPALLRRVPDARLRIIGTGPYEAELRGLVHALDLEGRVVIEGIPSSERQRLSDLLCSASLVVLLSEYEAHPVAIMEALSLRRPALVSDTSGLRELAEKGLCRSIPLDASPHAVAEAIAEELASRRELPEFALPDWDACTQQLLGIYKSVVGRRSHHLSGTHLQDRPSP